MRTLWRSRTGRVGLLLVSLIVLCATVSLLWTPHDPTELVPRERWRGISASHWFGTDGGGRDLFSQVLVGARLTLTVAVGSAAAAAVVGVSLGVLSASLPRWVGEPIAHVIDVLIALPTLILAIVLVAIFGGSVWTAITAIGIGSGVVIARTVRAEVTAVNQRDFITAANVSGSGTARTIVRHVLPNIAPTLIVQLSLTLALAVLAEASLAYLGLGARPGTPSWGRMLGELQQTVRTHPGALVFPGLAVVLTTLGFNLLGDGLRDVNDPRLRARRTRQAAQELPLEAMR